jgi:hypothetical protein
MTARPPAGFLACWACLGLCSIALAQSSVSINMGGMSIPTIAPPSSIERTSSPLTISAASGYQYTFNPTVQGTGFGSALVPSPTPLGDVLHGVTPGMFRETYGAMRNPTGAVPTQVFFEPVVATVGGLSLRLDLTLDILPSRFGRAAIRNISMPLFTGINITGGGAVIQTWTPPPPVTTEWHFDGNLLSVRETGLAPDSGPSKLRYLDDPAFGPILGVGHALPASPTPTGITQTQSAFGTTESFGIAPIAGEIATVYRTSPPRNASDPANQLLRRGIGVALFPNTRDFWPDDKISQWTLVFDLFIPQAAWASEYPVTLFDNNHNNAEFADALIRQSRGQGSIGHAVQPDAYLSSALIAPGRWMRLTMSTDTYRTQHSRFYVDGTFIGTSGSGWLYNSVKSGDPRFPDITTAHPVGTLVPPASWAAWGQFPSPWALLPDPANPSDPAEATPLGSTICLFADLLGRGESFYIASMLFTDDALNDAQVAALGGANARGIVFLDQPDCPADFNGDGFVNPDDLSDLITCFFLEVQFAGSCPAADFNGDDFVNPDDLADFITTFFLSAC